MTTLEILKTARGLIHTREGWTTGIVCDGMGRHCALGAIAHAALGDDFQSRLDGDYGELEHISAVDALASAMPDFAGENAIEAVWHGNDRKGYSYVMGAFDRAIAAEEARA